MYTSRILLCRPRMSWSSNASTVSAPTTRVVVPRQMPVMLRAPVFHAMKREFASQFITMSLEDVPVPDNDKLPLPPCDADKVSTNYAMQFRNPFKGNVNIPFLYTTAKQRENVTKRVNESQNGIIQAIRDNLAASPVELNRSVTKMLPSTPNYSLQADLLYGTDSDAYLLPRPLLPSVVDGKYTQTVLTELGRDDVAKAEDAQELYKGFFGSKHSGEAVNNAARDAAERAVLFMRQRINLPELFAAFGLDMNAYTIMSMYELHCYMYIRSLKIRNTAFGEFFGNYLLGHMDQLFREELKRTKMRSGQVEKVLQKRIPASRGQMIIYDKAMESFVAGDCEPLYGILYRQLFRNNEEPQKGDSSGFKKAPTASLLVQMEKPIDLAYMNNLVQYMVNELYNNATCSIRDFHAHVSGLTDFVPVPNPPTTMLGPLSSEEMLRYSFPIYNHRAVGPGIFTKLFRIVMSQPVEPEMLFQQAYPEALRPPTFIYTRADQEKGIKPN